MARKRPKTGTVAPDTDFHVAHARWLDWMSRDPHHSIWKQISGMAWNDAVFRTFNEARRLADSAMPTSAMNGMIARFVDHGYVATQVLAITKLVERFDEQDPKRGVISLRRLVDDIARHRDIFTRANFLAVDDLPYDYEAVEREWIDQVPKNKHGGWFDGCDVSGPRASGAARRQHDVFDRLSGIARSNRQPNDKLNETVITALLKILDGESFQKIKKARNKFVAHAADGHSRSLVDQNAGISLNLIDDVHRSIFRVAHIISSQILYDAARIALVPIPQYDQFEHLDCAFVTKTHLKELRNFWNRHCKDREKWSSEPIDLLAGAITDP